MLFASSCECCVSDREGHVWLHPATLILIAPLTWVVIAVSYGCPSADFHSDIPMPWRTGYKKTIVSSWPLVSSSWPVHWNRKVGAPRGQPRVSTLNWTVPHINCSHSGKRIINNLGDRETVKFLPLLNHSGYFNGVLWELELRRFCLITEGFRSFRTIFFFKGKVHALFCVPIKNENIGLSV